ncbi:MAG: tail fiber domain-containing protein [Caulobacteraceae bacterium]|nr:tail fiber domain-containing protein [Caulobacteraceae bacterium]
MVPRRARGTVISFIGKALGSLTGANQQAKAVGQASDAQVQAAQLGVDETRRQFDALQQLLAPYVQGGLKGLGGQLDLLGLNGNGAQQNAITALQQSPQFTSALQQGENSILQNASATGGLRGGNTQAALAQFSPALLSATLNDQYAKLGGLTELGQNSAAGVGKAGLQTGSQVAQLLQQQGSAQAGGITGQAAINRQSQQQAFNLLGNLAGTFFSDRRLKRNIVRIGTTARGSARYRWDWVDGSGSAEGVIADEVAHVPGALVAHPSGFAMVDYGKV